jgi:hypothetical protein
MGIGYYRLTNIYQSAVTAPNMYEKKLYKSRRPKVVKVPRLSAACNTNTDISARHYNCYVMNCTCSCHDMYRLK